MHEVAAQAVAVDADGNQPAPVDGSEKLNTVPLKAELHSTKNFTSRSERVAKFIQTDCWPLIATNYTRVFVWPAGDGPEILGFYSLSAFYVERSDLNNRYQRKAPGGIPAPMTLIGYMGKSALAPANFGAALIADAAMRVSRNTDVAFWGLCLHAENESLAAWYAKLGFTAARTKPLFLYAPFSALLPAKPTN